MTSTPTAVSIVLVSLLTLGACGGSDDADTVTTDPAVEVTTSATEPVAGETAPTEPPVTESPATEPSIDPVPAETAVVTSDETPVETAAPVTSPSDESGADCLVGDWVITQDEMNGYYDALEAALSANGPAPTLDLSGQVLLTFTPAEYIYTGNFDLTLGVAGQEGTGSSAGTARGTWTAADGVIVSETTSTDLSVSVSIGGITFDGTELANGLLDDAPINAAPFDCDGPSLGFETGAGSPRHSVTLTPA